MPMQDYYAILLNADNIILLRDSYKNINTKTVKSK